VGMRIEIGRPRDGTTIGATPPPVFRIWIRCCPRKSYSRKRRRRSTAGGDDVEGWDVGESGSESESPISWEESFYTPVFLHVVALTRKDRVLLLGVGGTPHNLGRCGMCGMACCDWTQEQHTRDGDLGSQDLQVAVRVQHTHPPRRPVQFEEIGGVDAEYQNLWMQTVKRDFAWCGVFDRIWNAGYEREQIARMFGSMPLSLRQVTASGGKRALKQPKEPLERALLTRSCYR
jgi:hypothetical protein